MEQEIRDVDSKKLGRRKSLRSGDIMLILLIRERFFVKKGKRSGIEIHFDSISIAWRRER